MPLLEDRTISFLVRLWCECGESGTSRVWRGSVEHMQTGERRFFQRFDRLLAFMRHASPEFDLDKPHDTAPGTTTGDD